MSPGLGVVSLGVVFSLFLGACRFAPRDYAAEYMLVDHLDVATAEIDGGSHAKVVVRQVEIGMDQRRAFVQPPPAVHRLADVPSGEGAVLLLSPTTLPVSWAGPSDGVGFRVTCRSVDGVEIPLLDLAIAPARVEADRRWHDEEIPLRQCGGPTTVLELETTCGPAGDCRADWPVWGDPHVRYRRTFEAAVPRIALLISVDTLRADRLRLYGAGRPTSPALEALAADGIVFEHTVAAAPWTIPSHGTMLTSTDPRVHGASTTAAIAPGIATVAQVFTAAGWRTGGFVDTPYLGREYGFDRGFAHFDDERPPEGDYRRGARVLRQRLLDWLASPDERPVFAFWHLMDVHGPYGAPRPFGGLFRSVANASDPPDPRLEQLRRLRYHEYLRLDRYRSIEDLVAAYDEGVAAADAAIGGLLDVLRELGLYDDALVIVTSDHGEALFDRGVWVGHGLFLFDEEIRVPLIVKLPGNRHGGTRVAAMVRVLDVAPTLLGAVGIGRRPASFQGIDLIAGALGEPGAVPRVAFGHSSNTGAEFVRSAEATYITPARMSAEAVLEKHLRAVEGATAPIAPLLDEVLLPGELAEPERVLARHRSWAEAQRERCAELTNRMTEAAAPAVSEEDRERLRALGYSD